MTTRRRFFSSLLTGPVGFGLAAGPILTGQAAKASAETRPRVRELAPSADFEASIAFLLDQLDGTGGDIVLAPGVYETAGPVVLGRRKVDKHRAERLPVIRICGYGATFRHTIEVAGRALHLAGLRVVEADGPGFRFLRSQQSHFADLQAIDCGQSGFLLGGSKGAQAAFGLWVNCLALGCASNGWELVADDSDSWVNANTFLNCVSRSNGATGLLARSRTNRVNYNHFFGMQIEGNSGMSVDFRQGARDNDLHGGHFVDQDASGVAIELGDGHNQMFGGRSVGLVNGGSAVIAQSPAYRGRGMVVRLP